MRRFPKRSQTLLIDADDTLWENNVYFERAIAQFITFLDHRECSPAQVRQKLYEVERRCVAEHGYGLRSFTRALVAVFENLSVVPLTPALRETIHGFARVIAEHPVELIAGVPETLALLRDRQSLILLTKGDVEEQARKIERSGLRDYFSAVEIVREKDEAVYRELAARRGLHRGRTWMIGNSPKSDINPALAAGLNAVFIAHPDTWALEHAELSRPGDQPGRLLELQDFKQLGVLF